MRKSFLFRIVFPLAGVCLAIILFSMIKRYIQNPNYWPYWKIEFGNQSKDARQIYDVFKRYLVAYETGDLEALKELTTKEWFEYIRKYSRGSKESKFQILWIKIEKIKGDFAKAHAETDQGQSIIRKSSRVKIVHSFIFQKFNDNWLVRESFLPGKEEQDLDILKYIYLK